MQDLYCVLSYEITLCLFILGDKESNLRGDRGKDRGVPGDERLENKVEGVVTSAASGFPKSFKMHKESKLAHTCSSSCIIPGFCTRKVEAKGHCCFGI